MWKTRALHNKASRDLVYTLAKEPDIHEVKPLWRFSKEQVHWLYDEFGYRTGR